MEGDVHVLANQDSLEMEHIARTSMNVKQIAVDVILMQAATTMMGDTHAHAI